MIAHYDHPVLKVGELKRRGTMIHRFLRVWLQRFPR
jgi:hypothetical protein